MGTARNSEWYDDAFLGSAAQRGPARLADWFPLWQHVVSLISREARVLDLGCGSGQLAELLYSSRWGGSYKGIDFSKERIIAARERCPRGWFMLKDLRYLTVEDLSRQGADVIVMTEVLEHLDDDIGLLRRLPSGVELIISVPTFDSASHVRHFPDGQEALERYEEFFISLGAITLNEWHILWGTVR